MRVLPEKEAMQWSEKGELRDIFALFCSTVSSSSREARGGG